MPLGQRPNPGNGYPCPGNAPLARFGANRAFPGYGLALWGYE